MIDAKGHSFGLATVEDSSTIDTEKYSAEEIIEIEDATYYGVNTNPSKDVA